MLCELLMELLFVRGKGLWAVDIERRVDVSRENWLPLSCILCELGLECLENRWEED